jgi:hypothetical protein
MTIFQGVILNGTEVINAPTIVGNTAFQTNDQTITFGQPLAAASTRLSQDTTRAQLVLGLGTALGSQLVIGANAWIGRDFDHAAPVNPTLFIHSAVDPDVTNTQWLSLTHDQTNAVITTGKGFLSLTGAGGAGGTVNIGSGASIFTLSSNNDLLINGKLETKLDIFLGSTQDPFVARLGIATNAAHPYNSFGAYYSAGANTPNVYFAANAYFDATGWHANVGHLTALWAVAAGGHYWSTGNLGAAPGTYRAALPNTGGLCLGASAVFTAPGPGNFLIDGNIYFSNITANFSSIVQDTTTDELKIGLGSEHGRQLVIGESTRIAHDFDHATTTDPTLFIHSATDPDVNNTQWMSLTHDQTNGRITSGLGSLCVGAGVPTYAILSGAFYVTGITEFNGTQYFISDTRHLSYSEYLVTNTSNGAIWSIGAIGKAWLKISSAYDQMTLGLASGAGSGHQFIICNYASQDKDYDHAPQADPTLFIHSATDPDVNNTQWMSLAHDQTNAIIATGLGDIILDPISEITEVCGVGLKTKEYNLTLNNGAKVNLPAGTGWGTFMIGDNQEYARIRWTAAAVVTLDEGTANVATADTPAFFCLYDDVATVAIKNNLGVNLTLRYVIHYS